MLRGGVDLQYVEVLHHLSGQLGDELRSIVRLYCQWSSIWFNPMIHEDLTSFLSIKLRIGDRLDELREMVYHHEDSLVSIFRGGQFQVVNLQ